MLRSRSLRSGLLLLTGALLLAVSGCGGNTQVNAQANAPPPTVQVEVVERRDVSLTSEWIATMDGYINAEIQPHVSGYLIRQDYREGSLVRKGEVLFEIDPRPFQAVLDQTEGQLAQTAGAGNPGASATRQDGPGCGARHTPRPGQGDCAEPVGQ